MGDRERITVCVPRIIISSFVRSLVVRSSAGHYHDTSRVNNWPRGAGAGGDAACRVLLMLSSSAVLRGRIALLLARPRSECRFRSRKIFGR